jgi:ankyrin repeat protein
MNRTEREQTHQRVKAERALWDAAMNHKAAEVLRILDSTPELLHSRGHRGQCLLSSAVFSDNHDWVVELVQRGIALDIQEEDGRTPLHIVVGVVGSYHHHNVMAITELLLKAGANPNLQAVEGLTPLAKAVERKSIEMAQLLLRYGADPTIADNEGDIPLMKAIMQNNKPMVQALYANGKGLDVYDKMGDTPLALALRFNKTEIARILLEAGSDPNLPTKSGSPMLFIPALLSIEIVRLFHEHGYEMTARDSEGKSLAAQAVRRGDNEVVRYVLEHTADVNSPDNSGRTPLHEAAMGSDTDIAELLLEQRASVTTPDSAGNTPLHSCILHGANPVMIRWLLNAGGDINARTLADETPLRLAITKRKAEAAALLLELGAAL